MSLIAPEQGQILFSALASSAALAEVLERRTKWGQKISSPLLAIAAGATLSSMKMIPSAAPIYDTVYPFLVVGSLCLCCFFPELSRSELQVFGLFMPMAVSLTLLETNVQRAFVDAGSTLKAFWIGALGTVVGSLVAFRVVGKFLGPDGWKIASCLCASYVGGSINYAATAQALGLTSGSTLAAGVAADNLAMGLYFSIIMAIPASDAPSTEDCLVEEAASPSVESLAVSIAAAASACTLGNGIVKILPSIFSGSGLGLMALFASIFSALAAKLGPVSGSSKVPIFSGSGLLGSSLMLLFFSTVGAACNLQDAISAGWPLFSFIILLLLVHLGTTLGLGSRCKLPMRVMLVASNANIGGPATAAAMANVRCWRELVHPAILVGTLGYTIGTLVGCAVGTGLLRAMA